MKNISIISNHGNYNNPNNLQDSIKMFNEYKYIDMIEIDVIYENNDFYVNHDYNNGGGDTLDTWLYNMIKINKYVWIDLKDRAIYDSYFDIIKFDNYLSEINNKLNLISYIFIGCQFKLLYEKMLKCKFIQKLNIIFDAIYAHYYIPKITSNINNYFYNTSIKNNIYYDIYHHFYNTNIIAIDISFFNDDLEIQDFIYKIPNNFKYIILYSLSTKKSFLYLKHQKIIYMYKIFL